MLALLYTKTFNRERSMPDQLDAGWMDGGE